MRRLELPRIRETVMVVKIRGISPLLCNRFHDPETLVAKVADHQNKDWHLTLYPLDGAEATAGPWGFPATAFKSALADAAARYVPRLTKKKVEGSVWVQTNGECVPIEGTPVEDVRIARNNNARGNPAIVVSRGKFPAGWEARLQIGYDPEVMTESQLLFLIQQAGLKVGVGNMRPGLTGHSFGRWETVEAMLVREAER